MIRRLSYIFLFFGVVTASSAFAAKVSVLQCMHHCGKNIQLSYEICAHLCEADK